MCSSRYPHSIQFSILIVWYWFLLFFFLLLIGQICRDYRLIDSPSFLTYQIFISLGDHQIWNGWQTKLYRKKTKKKKKCLTKYSSNFESQIELNQCDNNMFIIIRENKINSNWLLFSNVKCLTPEIQMKVYLFENFIIFVPLLFFRHEKKMWIWNAFRTDKNKFNKRIQSDLFACAYHSPFGAVFFCVNIVLFFFASSVIWMWFILKFGRPFEFNLIQFK